MNIVILLCISAICSVTPVDSGGYFVKTYIHQPSDGSAGSTLFGTTAAFLVYENNTMVKCTLKRRLKKVRGLKDSLVYLSWICAGNQMN